MTACPGLEGLVESWDSAGSAMGREAEPLAQVLVKGAVSPTYIIRVSGFIFKARDAPDCSQRRGLPLTGTDP